MYLKIITAAILTSLCISCSDNDADVVDAALVGRWYLAEVHDGPRMFVQDGTILRSCHLRPYTRNLPPQTTLVTTLHITTNRKNISTS